MHLEIKMEPLAQSSAEDENGFAGFDNSSRIPSTVDVGALNLWTSKATSCLITQYKKYRSMVGETTQIRSLREMFELISLEMQKFGFNFSSQKCENKWRVLERKYKNLVFRERLKKPGRLRHYGHWEHKKAMDEIFNEKKQHMYLDESDYPSPAASKKYALILPKPTENGSITATSNQVSADPLAAGVAVASQTQNTKRPDDSGESKGPLAALFERFLLRTEKNFLLEQQNKDRRHREKMAMRQNELEVQKKLLKLKEQEMELKKSQLLAAAQHLHLNM